MPELIIHNTLSKKKEKFIPFDPAHVRMYTCGPTVYNYAHIGNARPAVISDLLVWHSQYAHSCIRWVRMCTSEHAQDQKE
jgi:cysteinyl-tRNA synthetase